MKCLLLSGARQLLQQRAQSILALTGIALGVAVVLAIDLTNESAKRALQLANEAVAGPASHVIRGMAADIDEALYAELRLKHGLRNLSPMVTGTVRSAADGRVLRLIGIDPFADFGVRSQAAGYRAADLLTGNRPALMTRSTAKALDTAPGRSLRLDVAGRAETVTVLGLLSGDDPLAEERLRNVLVVDIALAQELLDKVGRLSRINVITEDPDRLDGLLPPSLELTESASRTHAMEQMTRAFHTNLAALSLLAVLIGAFLIFNTMVLLVLKQRSVLATFRVLGATRAQIGAMVLFQAATLAGLGTLLGLALGVWLADGLLHLVTQTINDLYFRLEVHAVAASPGSFGKAAALGLGTALVAALAPALEAARTRPSLALARSHLEATAARSRRLGVWAGLAALGLSTLVLAFSGSNIAAGFGALFLVIIGFSLLAPALMVLAIRRLVPRRDSLAGLLAAWAVRNTLASMSRVQVAIVALSVAVSATLGVGIMIDSFRSTVAQWLEHYLRADIYLSVDATAEGTGIDGGLIETLRAFPGVSTVSTGRWITLNTRSSPTRVFVVGVDSDAFQRFQFKQGDADVAWSGFLAQDQVIVSEPYAYHQGVALGDVIQLPTPGGDRPFAIAGVFYDYGSDRGVVVMHRETYSRHFDDPLVTSLALYLDSARDAERLIADLEAGPLSDTGITARSNRRIRELSLAIFDRTFAVTDVLHMLTLLVAGAGIFGALSAIQLERAREFAVLRANGLTRSELVGLMSMESGIIGLAAGLLAWPLGSALALMLIHVINRRSFGWSMQLDLAPEHYLGALLLSLGAAVVAGLYPAWRLARSPVLTALRHA